MAFSTRRGRPPRPSEPTDRGTRELQEKHARGLTAEPIDLCLARQHITPAQHWCALHWRWLYTVRYGAPSLISRYDDQAIGVLGGDGSDNEEWRAERAHEYAKARTLLQQHRRYEPVMRLGVFNELPVFLHPAAREKAWHSPAMAQALARAHQQLCEGLQLLVEHWRHLPMPAANSPQRQPPPAEL
jgi:hypothetical protein